jgi:hypothetical protein
VIWILWKKRNNVCFQGEAWRSVEEVLGRCARTVRNWMLVNREADAAKLDASARKVVWSTTETDGGDAGVI